MQKTLISIVGPTTAGKSTLAATLLTPMVSNTIFPIPLCAQREQRSDDDLRLVTPMPNQTFEGLEMFFEDTFYGVVQRDFNAFLVSDKSIGFSISTPKGLGYVTERLTHEFPYVRRCNVVLRLTTSREKELSLLSQRIDKYFPDPKANAWRKKYHLSFVGDFFHNQEYLDENCDVLLIQEGHSVADWCKTLNSYLGGGLISSLYLVDEASAKAMNRR